MRFENRVNNFLYAPAPFRLLPIRARTSGGATDFLLASALFNHRPTLRSSGEENARCVEPTSATHTNYVHPHLVRSRLASLVAQRGGPTESKAPYDNNRGTGCFTTSETASADRHCVLTSSSIPSRAGDTSVGVFFPRHSGDRASDTPVANLSLHPRTLPRASPRLPASLSSPLARVFTGWCGSEDAETRLDHR